MRAAKTILLILALSLLPAVASAETIRALEFRGLRAVAEETLRFYLGLEEGREFDEAALNRSILELWKRRLLDDIRVEKLPEGDGIRLVVTVVERPILRSLDYEGLQRLSRTDINDRLAKEQIDVRERDPLDLGELQRLETAIEEMYREKGYRFADASWKMEEVAPGERRVLFTIDEAEKVRIGAIRFAGNEVFGNRRLRWTMKKTKKTNLVTRMLKKDLYNPATVEEDLGLVKDRYRSAGYKDVDLGAPELSVLGGERGRKRRLAIGIPVSEGERWKLGKIVVEGHKVFAEEALLRRFEKPRGGWLRSKVLDKGVESVDEVYRNFGHIFARIDTEIVEVGDHTADFVVRIEEGDQYRVGRLEFEGNSRTRDKVLRREFRVHEGTVLNMGAIKNSLFKINQLGYFKLDEDEPISFENFDSEKKTVDLLLHGEESDRTEVQVGGGYSEGYGWFGQLSLRTQNFLGRGETVAVSFQSGRYADEFDVSYFVPWFLDRPQSIGIQLFNTKLDYSDIFDFDNARESQGAVVTYGRSFGLFSSFSTSLTRSDLTGTTTIRDAEGDLVPLETDLSNSSLRFAYKYESRDSRFEPTVGAHFSSSLEYAGGFLGGDNYFVRPEVGFSWFKPLIASGKVRPVFAFNIEGGMADPFDGRELDYFERYFLGGENSVRGFNYRSISVRCEGGEILAIRPDDPVCDPDEIMPDAFGRSQGGDKYAQLNLELHLLLGGPFRVLAFYDAANVYGDDQSVDLGRLRSSAGVELRVFVPVFGAPLRFIYASNLDPLPLDRFESFQFSIGSTF